MKKKLLFLAATALLVVNVIFVVKANNYCHTTADCSMMTVPPGYTAECVYGVCQAVPDDGSGGGDDCECIPLPPKTGSALYGYHNGECQVFDDGTRWDWYPGCVQGGQYCTLTI